MGGGKKRRDAMRREKDKSLRNKEKKLNEKDDMKKLNIKKK